MARSLSAAQEAALESPDRSTFVIVKVEDGDGNLVDMTDLEQGYDFLSSARIRASVEAPISSATIQLWREIETGGGDKLSLAPLVEGSLLNLNAAGSYDPAVNPARFVEVHVAVVEPGETPASGDYELLWEGYVDDVEWGGLQSKLVLHCRDPISRLNDTIIETTSDYGGGSPLEPIEDVMQAILDDNMGSGEFPLWVEGDPDFGIGDADGNPYKLGNVSVLEALKALADLIGWNLHWRYQESPGDFRLTFYEPIRDRANLSGFTPDWTFGPDDYYDLPGVRLPLAGVRNAGEVVYLDSNGDRQTVTEERSGSTAAYFRRFIRLDETPNRSIQTSAQASGLLSFVLDDLSVPPLLQAMDCAFHWPIELCDVHNFLTNAVHYDTTQTLAVFGYEHVLEGGPAGQGRIRTFVDSSGQPSGGFRRWLAREAVSRERLSRTPRIEGVGHRFDPDGAVRVTLRADRNTRSVRVAVSDTDFPTRETVAAAAAQAVNADGFVEVSLGGSYSPDDDVYVSAIAYETAAGGGFESDLTPTKFTRHDVEATKVLRYMATFFQPISQASSWSYGIGTLIPNSTGVSQHFRAPVVLPDGVTVTQVRARMGRAALSDIAEMKFYRIADAGTATLLATLTHSTVGGQTVSAAVNEAVNSTQYVMTLELQAGSAINDASAIWFEVTYTAPSLVNSV